MNLKFMINRAGSPTAWHTMWRTTGKLQDNDAWVVQHESMCRILEVGCAYDQLDAAGLASFELICRQTQTIEECQKAQFSDGSDFGSDHALMSGIPNRFNLCICPALSAWVDQEVAKESAALEEKRKAREEGALIKPEKSNK